MKQRLQKILARAGYGSRRACEELMREGRVCVNDETVLKPGRLADSGRDRITVDGNRVRPEKKVYIALNKPVGYLCTGSDPWGRKKVHDLLGRVPQRTFTIGRLDRDTEGLVLLTNDGSFAQMVAHPKGKVYKTYEVQIEGALSQKDRKRLECGIILDGRKTLPARVVKVSRSGRVGKVTIEIAEGRKRQLRRMFRAVGYPVKRLKRVGIGRLRLGSLPVGGYRFITREECKKVLDSSRP
jgi:23S rRNA pseudouridine2605 synthase